MNYAIHLHHGRERLGGSTEKEGGNSRHLSVQLVAAALIHFVSQEHSHHGQELRVAGKHRLGDKSLQILLQATPPGVQEGRVQPLEGSVGGEGEARREEAKLWGGQFLL